MTKLHCIACAIVNTDTHTCLCAISQLFTFDQPVLQTVAAVDALTVLSRQISKVTPTTPLYSSPSDYDMISSKEIGIIDRPSPQLAIKPLAKGERGRPWQILQLSEAPQQFYKVATRTYTVGEEPINQLVYRELRVDSNRSIVYLAQPSHQIHLP